ncbi:MAG: hypothetical protein ACFFCM_22005 [Promethearchaeota archaeon]
MSESKIVSGEARGFAGLIETVMGPLNENPKFQEAFKNTQRKILINATNLNYAALLTIDKGTLKIESIPNKPKSNLKKKEIGWDGYVAMDTMLFIGLAMRRVSIIKLGLKMLAGKVKIRGIFKLLSMLKLIKILTE